MFRYILSIVLLLFFFITCVSSQQVKIEATVRNLPPGKIFLSQIKGEEHRTIDSIFVSANIIRFNIKDPVPGVYRITLGKSVRANFFNEDPRFLDVIINNEAEIELSTDFNAPTDSMHVIRSTENLIYYKFLKREIDHRNKAGHIMPLFSIYSKNDEFYHDIKNEFSRLQNNYTDSIISYANQLPGSIAASIIRLNLLPEIDPTAGFNEMTKFLREHFFDLVSFNDARLIRSQAYTQKIIEYLSLFRNPGMTQSEQENEYLLAVDAIMERASYNEEVFDFVLNFLVDGFDRFKMENVLVYLAENYVEKGCETDSKKLMEQRLEAYKKMAVGNHVKDIVLLDVNGKSRRLSEIKNDYVLVIFWATWCPHCTRLLPEIKKWYIHERQIDLEIYSVSINTSRFDWEEHLLMNNYPWVNVCNFQGWEGKVSADYNIYATPTMFILDRNRKILAKPLTFREFKKELETIE